MTNLQKLQEETEKHFDYMFPEIDIEKESAEIEAFLGKTSTATEMVERFNSLQIKIGQRHAFKRFFYDYQLLAYNQGVKDSVEALPEVSLGSALTPSYFMDEDGTYLIEIDEYREEAITNLNKLIQ